MTSLNKQTRTSDQTLDRDHFFLPGKLRTKHHIVHAFGSNKCAISCTLSRVGFHLQFESANPRAVFTRQGHTDLPNGAPVPHDRSRRSFPPFKQ